MSEVAWRYSPALVEDALQKILAAPRDAAESGHRALYEAMQYAVLGGGKRLRSQLLLEASGVVGGPGYEIETSLPAACALELIHAYSLVHDDLPAMDDAATRRGRPSCHAKFGDAVAILAGDALQTLAFEVLANGIASRKAGAAVTLRAVSLIAQAAGAVGMAGGQAIDIAWSDEPSTEVQDEQLLRMHGMKTGALIRVACEAGAVLGGGTAEQVAALRRYGEHLGSAFQIHDDVLDVEGDPQLTGKSSTDVANDKTTAPAVFGMEEAKRRAASASAAAVSALMMFGAEAEALRQLARFVVQRAK